MEIPDVVVAYIQAYNGRDPAALADCVAEDVVFENVSNSGGTLVIEGRSAFADLAAQAAALFLHREMRVRNAVVTAGSVALEIDWTGTAASDFGPFKAGEPAAMRGATFLTLDGNKLTRITDLS